MATSQIIPFATAPGANVQDLASYAAAPATATGFVAGVANSGALNRAWRQSSFMAAASAQHLVNLGIDVLDDGDVSGLAVKFRRTMGSAANIFPLNANGVLPSTAVGQLVVFTATNVLATLPASGSVPLGAIFRFFSSNVGGCRVGVAGADTFVLGNGLSAAPVLFGAGDTGTFIAGANGWNLTDGTASLRYSAAFATMLGVSGYVQIPGGVIIQKGQVLCPAANTFYTFNFPIAFPTSAGSTTVVVTQLSGAPVTSPATHNTPLGNSVQVSSGTAGSYVDILAVGS